MTPNPPYLEANWHKVKTVVVETGELDRLTKEIIAVAQIETVEPPRHATPGNLSGLFSEMP